MKRILASRGFVSITGLAIVAALLTVGYLIAFDPAKRMQSYCAIMPDAIGLYVDNDVTMRGIAVGEVTRIEPQAPGVRVDFDVDAAYPLRSSVSATTVSHTLVADRNLAVLTGASGESWDPSTCITDTLTPKSMTQMLNALGKISDELTNSGAADQTERVREGIANLDAATSGAGPRLNELIVKLASALDSPDAAIGHIGDLVGALASLSASAAVHWPDIKSMLTRFAAALDVVNNELLLQAVALVDYLTIDLPMLNDITTMFGGPILQGLEATVPLIHFAAANVASLQQLVGMIPPLTQAFQRSRDPDSGQPSLTYMAPTELNQSIIEQICATADSIIAAHCASASHINLAELIMNMAAAR
jgi:phospholipid/cholesterol/gamma-HCH transport system substrate-binding protein